MNSILEELRCMDGELFRSELTQRFYLLLKSQASETLGAVSKSPKSAQFKTISQMLLQWPANVRDEELRALRTKAGEDTVEPLFVQVVLLYVKLSHKSNENRTLKIKAPRLEDMVRNFYSGILTNQWGASGELWTLDPIKMDFVLRECFRRAIMESVQILSSGPASVAPSVTDPPAARRPQQQQFQDARSEVYPDDSISSFEGPVRAPFRYAESEAPSAPRPQTTAIEDSKTVTFADDALRGRDNDGDSASRSTSSSRSSSSSSYHRDNDRKDEHEDEDEVEYRERHTHTRDDSKSVFDRQPLQSADDLQSVHQGLSAGGGGTAASVVYKPSNDAASIGSSVSRASSNSRYSSASLTKPRMLSVGFAVDNASKLIPISEMEDDDGGDETISVTLSKKIE